MQNPGGPPALSAPAQPGPVSDAGLQYIAGACRLV